MESTLELSRWREQPRGLLSRLRTIIFTGLQHELRTRFFRGLLFTAWTGAAAIALMGFVLSQALASGGWVETSAAHFGLRGKVLFQAFTGFSALYPELSIGGFFRLVFWAHAQFGLILSLLALTAMVPRLVTRDRASNALTVYFSRPLNSTDYLLGKFGIIIGVMVLLWTGPLLVGWLLSLGFAPDRDFVIHGFAALRRALLFNAIAVVSLGWIALGVSAASRNGRHTSILWIALWLLAGVLVRPAGPNHPLRRISFSENLREVRTGIFQLEEVWRQTAENLPFLNLGLETKLKRLEKAQSTGNFRAALASLAAMSALCSLVLFRNLRSP